MKVSNTARDRVLKIYGKMHRTSTHALDKHSKYIATNKVSIGNPKFANSRNDVIRQNSHSFVNALFGPVNKNTQSFDDLVFSFYAKDRKEYFTIAFNNISIH